MSSVHHAPAEVEYPESDGKPMAETPLHRDNMFALIDMLRRRFADDPMTYVSGNMLLYYERGNSRKCVAPDVFVARVRCDLRRGVYKTWEEGGRGPELVIEVTSPSTRDEDLKTKFELYRDTLQVAEYFVFDPLGEYLDPPLRGYRLIDGRYAPIEPVDGRLPSAVLGLHFEAGDPMLRLYDPVAGRTLVSWPDGWVVFEQERETLERARQQESAARQDAERARREEEAARLAAEAELARLRRELNELRRRPENESG